MSSTCCSGHPRLLLYYGVGGLETLRRYERVVLQPTHYSREELGRLRLEGARPLAYLALGEDTGTAGAPWQRPARNEAWGGHYVMISHPGWRQRVLEQAAAALESGFEGFLLDTLELRSGQLEDAPALLALVADLRALVGAGYLIANRGLVLHEQLAPLVDAFLFEAFSTTWEDGYSVLPSRALLENVRWQAMLAATGRELFALDYADREELSAFARARAANLGLPLQVTDRQVTCLPQR